jgi:hypothetical protein
MTSNDEEIRKCSVCDKSNVALFNILLPPTIREPVDLCEPCLKVAIDDSKKKDKGKAVQ